MQRLLPLKLLSRNHSNFCNNSSSSYGLTFQENLLSSLSRTSKNHVHNSYSSLNQSRHFFSHLTNSTTTATHPWRSMNYFSGKFHGFLSNPVVLKRFLSNTLFKGPLKSPIDCGVGFLRAQSRRRNFHIDRFEFQRRTWQSWYRRLTTENVVWGLILANAGIFMLWRIADQRFMKKNFMISLDNIRSGRLHTMITSAFSHMEPMHLISNMIGLYFFGMSIGRSFGPEYLLKLYVSGALVGSIFYLVYHAYLASSSKLNSQGMWKMDPSRIPGLGASGAVNAIMLLDIFLFPTKTIYLEFFIPVPAILVGIIIIGQDMYRVVKGDTQISGSAHLGGAVAAAIAWARIRKGRF